MALHMGGHRGARREVFLAGRGVRTRGGPDPGRLWLSNGTIHLIGRRTLAAPRLYDEGADTPVHGDHGGYGWEAIAWSLGGAACPIVT